MIRMSQRVGKVLVVIQVSALSSWIERAGRVQPGSVNCQNTGRYVAVGKTGTGDTACVSVDRRIVQQLWIGRTMEMTSMRRIGNGDTIWQGWKTDSKAKVKLMLSQ